MHPRLGFFSSISPSEHREASHNWLRPKLGPPQAKVARRPLSESNVKNRLEVLSKQLARLERVNANRSGASTDDSCEEVTWHALIKERRVTANGEMTSPSQSDQPLLEFPNRANSLATDDDTRRQQQGPSDDWSIELDQTIAEIAVRQPGPLTEELRAPTQSNEFTNSVRSKREEHQNGGAISSDELWRPSQALDVEARTLVERIDGRSEYSENSQRCGTSNREFSKATSSPGPWRQKTSSTSNFDDAVGALDSHFVRGSWPRQTNPRLRESRRGTRMRWLGSRLGQFWSIAKSLAAVPRRDAEWPLRK